MTHSYNDHSPLSLTDAQQIILAALAPIAGRERLAVRSVLNRVLAEPVIAPCNVPAHDNAAMDGYAVRFEDLNPAVETTLTVIGTAFAGKPFSGHLTTGKAVRIMTGAVIPKGADTVIVQEVVRTNDTSRTVTVPVGQRAGQNLRRAGENLTAGNIALTAGTHIGPAELGLIASLGLAEVTVYRRLRVAFFSTGDEIASIGHPLLPGQIYDSNRYTLFGVLSQLNCELLDMGVVPDQPEALETALHEASLAVDVIITSGGVSAGEADFIRDITHRLGKVSFWKINIKPGRPMAFGRIGNAALFGLPGNPVAVLVTFYQFVQNALLKLMGVSPLPTPQVFNARLKHPFRKQPGRHEFVRGHLDRQEDGTLHVSVTGSQSSGVLRSMSEADCFIVLPDTCGNLEAGDTVTVQPFSRPF